MSEMRIITNHRFRNFLNWEELTETEKMEFDLDENREEGSYFRYRGVIYSLNEIERSSVPGWDGQHCDSFFSAVLVKLSDDGDQVKCGLALC